MSTENFEFCLDMNGQNPVFVLHRAGKCTLGAVAHVERNWEEKVGATRRAIAILSKSLEAAFPHYAHWLAIGHASWQANNRIIKHKKLWASLLEQGISLPKGQRGAEVLLESEKGVKYFSCIKCDSATDEAVAPALRSGWEVQLLFVDNSQASAAIPSLVGGGWERRWQAPPAEILDFVCDTSALAYLPLGWFDDRESGCAVIGAPGLLAEAFSELRDQK